MSKNLSREEFQTTFIRFEALQEPPTDVSDDVDLIFNWGKELKAAHKNYDNEAWCLAGRAITILNDDVERCRQILKYTAWHAGFHFSYIASNHIRKMLKSLEGVNLECPYILYIEPGPWMFKIRNCIPSKEINQLHKIRSMIRGLITASDSRFGCVIVTSVSEEEFQNFDEEFRQVQLFSRRFHLEAPLFTEVADSFIHKIGKELCDESLTNKMQEAGNHLQMKFKDERRQALVALGMKRLAKRKQRKVGYSDLLYFVVNGSAEFASTDEGNLADANQVAIHEAGHASVAMIDSEGQDIPEYVSIMETNSYKGVMIESIAYNHPKSNILTYKQFRHTVRVCLAGRVAEHLVLGSENVSCYAASYDLEKATDMARSMFGFYGISPNMENSDAAAQNLIVRSEVSEITSLTRQRTDQMVNIYLEKQYKWVLDALQTHRDLLNAITQELIIKKVLNQEDLNKIFNKGESTKPLYSDMIDVEK